MIKKLACIKELTTWLLLSHLREELGNHVPKLARRDSPCRLGNLSLENQHPRAMHENEGIPGYLTD